MSEIEFISEDIEYKLKNDTEISLWLQEVANKEGQQIESLTYIFCTDNYLLEVNREHLDHDYYTDIITFDNRISETDDIIGDIFISIDRVKENAEEYNQPFDKEIKRVLVHGLLHLLGYNDKTEEDSHNMRSKEDFYIA